MNYHEFLRSIIEEGIVAARRDYREGSAKQRGAIAGFEACRGKDRTQLLALLAQANEDQELARRTDTNYWYARCFALEVLWVCNVLSAALHNEGKPVLVEPTGNALMLAARILGLRLN